MWPDTSVGIIAKLHLLGRTVDVSELRSYLGITVLTLQNRNTDMIHLSELIPHMTYLKELYPCKTTVMPRMAF